MTSSKSADNDGQPSSDAAGADIEANINTSLNDVLDLLGSQVQRLQATLDLYRVSDVPNKQDYIRYLVDEIDARHDRMDEVKALILSAGDASQH